MSKLPANARAAAAQAVLATLSGSSLDDAFAKLPGDLPARDQAFAKTLAYGVLREHRLLSWLIAQLLDKPLPATSAAHALLAVGLHQLRTLGTPPHAAVGETVNASEALGIAKARGLINAILRRYQRESAALEERLPADPAIRHSYPDWLSQAVWRDWGEQHAAVLEAGNEPAPLTLRVNRRRGSREDYLRRLAEIGMQAEPLPGLRDALRLAEPCPVDQLPGFADGLVSVQDASAQLAVDLLELRPRQRLLDACAAPGGKTAQALERQEELFLTALDKDAKRLARVRQNLDRLGLSCVGFPADAADTRSWWNGEMFDRILLDAPCSGSGVIRRHPDIKWLRRADDISKLAAQQTRLLEALWPTLAPGGVLVYATCSILRAEGEEVLRSFLVKTPDAQEKKIDARWGEPRSVGRRIAPGALNDFDGDGFYYARLVKRSPGAGEPTPN